MARLFSAKNLVFGRGGFAYRLPIPTASFSSHTVSLRFQSSASPADATMVHGKPIGNVTKEQVWGLWNEGNLFSLSITQMQDFLSSVGLPTEPGIKKAAVVRRLEEYLHAEDTASGVAPADSSPQHSVSGHGRWLESVVPPETLLDLAQSGFYDGAANVAPHAFQFLPHGSSADTVISRVNTTAFPGFPANMECYTISPADATVSLQARFSKVLQWCFLNMSNLQMDGELVFSLGKLLMQPSVMPNQGDTVVSAYTLQQRLQLTRPFTFVTAVPESVVPIVETFLTAEGFTPVTKSPQLSYDGTIKRAKDILRLELDSQGKLLTLNNEWSCIQTAHHTKPRGPDIMALLRLRPPVRRSDVDTFSQLTVIELANDDVTDVLPAEHGQLVYLSENETRRFEKVDDHGMVVSVTEVKRQPLIVLHDEEEDPRLEYSVSVNIPAATGSGRAIDIRAVGLDLLELTGRFAAVLEGTFVEEFGCAQDA